MNSTSDFCPMLIVTHKRFTLEEYHRLEELGFIGEDDRVELIRGEILLMAAKRTPHSVCNSLLLKELYQLIGERAIVRGQEPIILPPNSEPEPDAVIALKKADHLSAHPSSSDILLIIEIADSTLKYDQEVKLALYAEAGIANYWLINLVNSYLEAYNEPYQDKQGNFGYASKRIFFPSAKGSLPSFSDLSLNLSLVFPLSKTYSNLLI